MIATTTKAAKQSVHLYFLILLVHVSKLLQNMKLTYLIRIVHRAILNGYERFLGPLYELDLG